MYKVHNGWNLKSSFRKHGFKPIMYMMGAFAGRIVSMVGKVAVVTLPSSLYVSIYGLPLHFANVVVVLANVLFCIAMRARKFSMQKYSEWMLPCVRQVWLWVGMYYYIAGDYWLAHRNIAITLLGAYRYLPTCRAKIN